MSAPRRARTARAFLPPLVAGLLVLSPGCERATTPATSQAAAAARAARWQGRDWVLNPPLAVGEREVPCGRILSAAPNVTEICCALGLRRCLVGRTRYCTYPPDVASVPSIGALNDLNVEALLAINADLVLISGTSRAISDRLDRLALRYESLPDTSLGDLYAAIERVGALTGRPETTAALVACIRADLAAIAAQHAPKRRTRVLLLTAPLPDPPSQVHAAGPGSFYDDLLQLAGFENAGARLGRPFAPIALEFVLEVDPDVIIELLADAQSRPAGDADARRAWALVGPLKAVATDRVHVLAGAQHFLLGPRVPATFAALCDLMRGHGDE